MPKVPGLIKGLGITLRELMTPAVTVQYPHVKEAPAPRARGVIALLEENCTVCMLCARSCPDWCIYIEGHKTKAPPRRAGGKPRTVQLLDRFDIDYALCMYCGICVEVCPFDALFWSPEFEYSEPRIADMLHDKAKLGEWMATVPDNVAYETGSEAKVKKIPGTLMLAQNITFGILAAATVIAALRLVTTKNVVHAALYLVVVLSSVAALYILLFAEFVAIAQLLVYVGAVVVLFLFGIMLTRAQLGHDQGLDNDQRGLAAVTALFLVGVLTYVLVDFFGSDKLPSLDGVSAGQITAERGSQAVGDSIFSTYLVPFEAVSLLLLAALVGAIVIARRD